MRERQHFQHSAAQHLFDNLGRREAFERVEHRLRPRPHLLGLAAGQVTELLAADRVQRTEDDDLALRPTFEHGFEAGAQRERRLSGARLAAEGHDADAVVEEQVECDPLLSRTPVQPECLTVAPDQLDLLGLVDPAQGTRRAVAQQPNSRVAGQFSCSVEINDPVGEQRVDDGLVDVELRHARPSGDDDVLCVVLVGVESDGTRLDAQRRVLGHQRDVFALGAQVECAREDAGVVAVGAESGGQHRGIGVVELDLQGAALVADRQRDVESAVLEPQVVEQSQCLTCKPSKLVVVTFALEFADDNQRQDDVVFSESCDCPGI